MILLDPCFRNDVPRGKKLRGFFPIYRASRLVLQPLQVSKTQSPIKGWAKARPLFRSGWQKRPRTETFRGEQKCIKSCFMEQDSIFIICQESTCSTQQSHKRKWRQVNFTQLDVKKFNENESKSAFQCYKIYLWYLFIRIASKLAIILKNVTTFSIPWLWYMYYLHFWMSEYYTFT